MNTEARMNVPAHASSLIDQLHAEAAELRPDADRLLDWTHQAADLIREVQGAFVSDEGEYDSEAAAEAGMEPIDQLFDDVSGGHLQYWGAASALRLGESHQEQVHAATDRLEIKIGALAESIARLEAAVDRRAARAVVEANPVTSIEARRGDATDD